MVGGESGRTCRRADKFSRGLDLIVHVHMGLETELRVNGGRAGGLWVMIVLKKGISIGED